MIQLILLIIMILILGYMDDLNETIKYVNNSNRTTTTNTNDTNTITITLTVNSEDSDVEQHEIVSEVPVDNDC